MTISTIPNPEFITEQPNTDLPKKSIFPKEEKTKKKGNRLPGVLF